MLTKASSIIVVAVLLGVLLAGSAQSGIPRTIVGEAFGRIT